MADLLFPPHACISAQRVDVVSNTASARSIFTGATRTVDRGGDRFRWAITRSNASDRDGYAERAILKAFLAQARGQASRIWFADPGYRQRGSFPSTELLANPMFANGTTGWSSNIPSQTTIAVADRVMRLTRVSNINPTTITSAATATPYAPYVARAFGMQGRGQVRWDLRIRDVSDATIYATTVTAIVTPGMLTCAGVPYDTDIALGIVDRNTGKIAGDYMDIAYASLSRCALIDNGTNLLLQSDEFDTTWTATRASVDDQADTAPDGTLTADRIIEDSTASQTHHVSQSVTVSSAVGDYCFAVALKPNSRTWAYLQMSGASTSVSAYFNLSTGAVGTTFTGANWSNLRTFVVSLGDSWLYCCIVARKTDSSTTITPLIGLANGNGGASYSGDGVSNIRAWRATLAQSSVPTRLVQTTTTATPGTSQTGNALYVKGLPASTNGLLLPGDRVQIGNQLCEVVAPLNSDAAGLGYLQIAWPLRTPPADNAPVIINNPMARCVLTSNEGGWSDTPGGFSEFDFQLEEALDE